MLNLSVLDRVKVKLDDYNVKFEEINTKEYYNLIENLSIVHTSDATNSIKLLYSTNENINFIISEHLNSSIGDRLVILNPMDSNKIVIEAKVYSSFKFINSLVRLILVNSRCDQEFKQFTYPDLKLFHIDKLESPSYFTNEFNKFLYQHTYRRIVESKVVTTIKTIDENKETVKDTGSKYQWNVFKLENEKILDIKLS